VSASRDTSVDEIKPGHFVWFSDEGAYREAVEVHHWSAKPGTFERDLAWHWVTVTYADGHVHEHIRHGGHDVWESGDRPMVGAS
jgi:hypothetical protein